MYIVNHNGAIVFCSWNPLNLEHLPYSSQELQGSELSTPQKEGIKNEEKEIYLSNMEYISGTDEKI